RPQLGIRPQHAARPLHGKVRVGGAEVVVQARPGHRSKLVAAVICSRRRGLSSSDRADTMPRALRPAPQLLRRAAVAGVLLSLLAPAAALANYISPEDGGSPNANDVNTLYVITLVIAIFIFLLVEGVLIYSLIKFRRRRRDEEPAQIRGNTTLEVGWTLGAAAILVVLTVVTFIYLPGIKNPSASEP